MFRNRLLRHRILQRLREEESGSQYEILRVREFVFAEGQINRPLPTHGIQPELKTPGNTLRFVAWHTELSARSQCSNLRTGWVCVVEKVVSMLTIVALI